MARQWSLRQLISTTMMIPADTDFAIRGVWDSTDCVQLHVAITFLNDVILYQSPTYASGMCIFWLNLKLSPCVRMR